ncbi:2-phospho-L-lactate guanylyltransferase [Skermania piniformis]|uniref:Phosphoenolpyruvate guanylyltransferase n=2 Tax=Skermania pinensis TaxID=39122 RepID=A0ABX8SEX6_9ACTN|nr:2-phospho-L-lactate guanylyltransferase [Skermania piniformis]
MRTRVHAVIAVKRLGLAKSRLGDTLAPAVRRQLVLAMLADTGAAAGAASAVVSITVVSPDRRVRDAVTEWGWWALAEPPNRAAPGVGGLNAALQFAASRTRRRHGPGAILAVQADLPALRPAELTAFLAAAPGGRRSFVADQHGVGTTALLQPDPTGSLDPRFGPRSADRHRAAGAAEPSGEWPGLRHDVDTAADLAVSHRLGTGPTTAGLLREIVDMGWQGPKFPTGSALWGCPGSAP